MTSLLAIELRKLVPYRTFWAILAVYAALMVLIVYFGSTVTINGQNAGTSFYQFPEFWSKLTYIASYFNLLLGILVIISVTDEYAFRTLRQQVIDGYSRANVVQAKYSVVLLLGAACAVFVFLLGLFFGSAYGEAGKASNMFTGAPAVVYYFLQAVGYMSLAMVFGFWIKKSGPAIIAFLLYSKVIEPIIQYNVPDALDQYFPMKTFSALTPMPSKELFEIVTGASESLSMPGAAAQTVLYVTLFCFISYWLLRSRDL